MEKLIVDDTTYETHFTEKYKKRKSWQQHDARRITSFLPGTIREVCVRAGQKVKMGDTLFVFEAMKMLNTVKSHDDGTVKLVHITVGTMVAKGQLLIEFE
jgi:pyruvate carboxylase